MVQVFVTECNTALGELARGVPGHLRASLLGDMCPCRCNRWVHHHFHHNHAVVYDELDCNVNELNMMLSKDVASEAPAFGYVRYNSLRFSIFWTVYGCHH